MTLSAIEWAVKTRRETHLVFLRCVRHHALDLVDAFGFTPELLPAEISTGIEAEPQDETQANVDAQRAAGTWAIQETR